MEQFGDHIVFNFSFSAVKNDVNFVTDIIFDFSYGYTKREIEYLCTQL